MAAHEEVYEFHLVHAIITQTQNIDGLFVVCFIIRCKYLYDYFFIQNINQTQNIDGLLFVYFITNC